MSNPFFNSSGQFCAIDPDEVYGACHGDSGGPAIAERPDGTLVEVGITSTGMTGCPTRRPQVFTRVEAIWPWLNSWMLYLAGEGPQPVIRFAPRRRVPRLTFRQASYYAEAVLIDFFGGIFARGRAHDGYCLRIDRSKVKCSVLWVCGRFVYRGGVTIWYSLPREGSIWSYNFRIKRYTIRCYLRRGANRCPRVVRYPRR